MSKPHFRAGVVLVVRRTDGDVLAFERADAPGSWQLPQGGLEDGETPVDAAWRELREETGLLAGDVRLAGEHPEWTVYELPEQWRKKSWLGQAHRWFFFELVDDTTTPSPDGSEFVSWAWFSPQRLIEQVAGFRKRPYQQVLGGRDV